MSILYSKDSVVSKTKHNVWPSFAKVFFFSSVLFLLLASIFLRYSSRIEETDLWFQMAYGKYLIEHRTLITGHTVFSWSPADDATIYCAWIPQMLLHILYKAGGLTYLFALRYVCLALFLLLVFSHVRKNRVLFEPLTWLLCLMVSLMVQLGLQIKPEILSFILMCSSVWTWWKIKASKENGWKYCYLFPVIVLLWINTHGGVVFGLVFLGTLFLGEMINIATSRREMLDAMTRRHFLISLALCGAATLINPYGLSYPLYLVKDLLVGCTASLQGFNSFAAYQDIFSDRAKGLHFVLYLWISLVTLTILLWPRIRDRRIDWTLIISNAFFCVLYVKLVRTTLYWPIILLFSSLSLLSDFSMPVLQKKKYVLLVGKGAVSAAFFYMVVLAGYASITSPYLGFKADYLSPIEEAAYIGKHYKRQHIGNDYDTGAYLLWYLWPDSKVLVDARYFPYKAWIHEYLKLKGSTAEYKDWFLQKYRSDVWCVSYHHPDLYTHMLRSPDMKLVYYGPSAGVFVSTELSPKEVTPLTDDSIYDINVFQLPYILNFAKVANEIEIPVRIIEALKLNILLPSHREMFLRQCLSFGMHLLDLDKTAEAARVFTRMASVEPDNIWAHFYLGNVLMNMNDIPGAIRSYKKVLKLNPDFFEAHYNIGNLYFMAGRISDAVEHYNTALNLKSMDSRVQSLLDAALQKKKETVSAIAKLENHLDFESGKVKQLYNLAVLYSSIGQYEKALSCFTAMIRLKPDSPEISYNIACIYSRQGRVEESVRYLRDAFDKGFKDWTLLKNDPDMDALRSTSFYAGIIKNHLAD